MTAADSAVVYSRKFHKPTGGNDQRIVLKITLFPTDSEDSGEVSAVLVNGLAVEAQAEHATPPILAASEDVRCVYFQLSNLAPFNQLDIRVTGTTPTIGTALPGAGAGLIPTFGSFVIQSVELQIE